MTLPGTPDTPLRVAVVGTGPSGMYAAAALLASDRQVEVDLLDRLPAPYGLVRYGVAPDHQKIKAVSRVFERVAADPRVRFYGHVHVGRDLTRADLARLYHQVVYAVGAQGDRELGIPGEELAGSISSTELVAWYNCHPDYADCRYPLGHERVVVVGVGNVAMDVARVLVKAAEELAATDISDAALEELRASRVREVTVLARRGPVQAKFSPPELKEIAELAGVQVVVDPAELELDPGSEAELAEDRAAQKNLDLLRELAAAPVDPARRRVRFRFLVSPTRLVGEDGRVVGVEVERNRLVADERGWVAAVGTGEREVLPATLVVRAIGYRSDRLMDLPFDERRCVIPNVQGRVVGADGAPLAGEYVVGWVKRGPTGLIGSNKMDAQETVDRMLEDAGAGRVHAPAHPRRDAVVALLVQRGVEHVCYEDWRRLDEIEQARGAASGRPRVKIGRVEEMLREMRGEGAAAASANALSEPAQG